jgi:hypothetical protein
MVRALTWVCPGIVSKKYNVIKMTDALTKKVLNDYVAHSYALLNSKIRSFLGSLRIPAPQGANEPYLRASQVFQKERVVLTAAQLANHPPDQSLPDGSSIMTPPNGGWRPLDESMPYVSRIYDIVRDVSWSHLIHGHYDYLKQGLRTRHRVTGGTAAPVLITVDDDVWLPSMGPGAVSQHTIYGYVISRSYSSASYAPINHPYNSIFDASDSYRVPLLLMHFLGDEDIPNSYLLKVDHLSRGGEQFNSMDRDVRDKALTAIHEFLRDTVNEILPPNMHTIIDEQVRRILDERHKFALVSKKGEKSSQLPEDVLQNVRSYVRGGGAGQSRH